MSVFDTIIIVLLIGGASTFSIYLQLIFSILGKLDFVVVYGLVLMLVLLYASFFHDLKTMVKVNNACFLLWYLLVAFIGGLIATKLDRRIIRRANRKLLREREARRKSYSNAFKPGSWSKSGVALPPITALIVVAILEEMLFRGVLVEMSLASETIVSRVFGLIALTLLFALIHIQIGWVNILAKLPLGILTLLCVLMFDSVIPAIIIHIIFNVWVWVDLKNQPKHNRLSYS